ncbi:MAG: CRISPR-associated protein Cas5 [Deferribacteraceae bacterium]|jgi:CRISPR-associated protein Cas5t|nr:CRISPR-associated protein Cas5 [Deferribacteraceae bacterium]
MKALRVELYQDHVCWRQETGYRFFQTYPLPTPSMVRGLVHKLMGVKPGGNRYIPLKISIQGRYDSIFVDMQRWDMETKKRNGASNADSHTLMFWEELANVCLTLHIAFKNDNETNLIKLKEGFIGNTVVLGRNEDITRIDSIDIVELVTPSNKLSPKYPMFMPKNEDNEGYPVFHLPFAYSIIGSQRIFKYIDACLINAGSQIKSKYCLVACNYPEHPVCFLELNDDDEKDISEK